MVRFHELLSIHFRARCQCPYEGEAAVYLALHGLHKIELQNVNDHRYEKMVRQGRRNHRGHWEKQARRILRVTEGKLSGITI